mgnify:CR=1 FL=1
MVYFILNDHRIVILSTKALVHSLIINHIDLRLLSNGNLLKIIRFKTLKTGI